MTTLKKHKFSHPLELESGALIHDFEIAYQTFGTLNQDKSNVIWVFHPLSANTDVLEWWNGLFDDDKAFDLNEYYVVCTNAIGSPYGTTMPRNLNFPNYTMRDIAQANIILADALDIQDIHTCIGASFGGNIALELAYALKDRIKNLILIASSARESAWAIAIHESQRIALKSDPTFGTGGQGQNGMKAARAAALLNYRTSESFINTQTDEEEVIEDFKASSYIRYQGEKFVKRFDALSYYYLMNCLDSHNIGRGRGGTSYALKSIQARTLVIGITSDALVPISLQRQLVEYIPDSKYVEFDSAYGHDAFLVEQDLINDKIYDFLHNKDYVKNTSRRTVLKFGGKSLANGKPIQQVIEIIQEELQHGPIAVIVSARGESTDALINLHDMAVKGEDYSHALDAFLDYQEADLEIDLSREKQELGDLLHALSIMKTSHSSVLDRIVAFGEILSTKVVSHLLQQNKVAGIAVDARKLIFTHRDAYGKSIINTVDSTQATQSFFSELKDHQVPIISGYIASDEEGKTTTLGRNGSNFSATLIASFIHAKEVQNWTNVSGIYTANPKYVPNASLIENLSYKEANELVNFGMNILHPKTILPLVENDIPLVIKSSHDPSQKGTVISKNGAANGIKAVSVIEDVALVSIEGKGLYGNVGIDGRIFSALKRNNISVRLISQASSERSIGFVVNLEDAKRTELVLHEEFENDLKHGIVSDIAVNAEIAIIAIVGRHNYSLEKAIAGLRRNKIWMHLISNSISGEHISLVIDKKKLHKAVKVIHNKVFGVIKTINVVAFGKGVVGGELIEQILNTTKEIEEKRSLRVQIVGIADSHAFIFDENGIGSDWRERLAESKTSNRITDIITTLRESGLENIVIADNTSSELIADSYPRFIKKGFDIVASNKKANSSDHEFYDELRRILLQKGRRFYYEANVGAGLPIIDTIKHLYHSSDKITRIRGVFSGSLGYIFSAFSSTDLSFSEVLMEAKQKGFTEPDPREDLSGLDVARKLIILAREVGYTCELVDVEVQNLIPESLRDIETYDTFLQHADELNDYYNKIKADLKEDEVLRYVGELIPESNELQVKLISTPKQSALGSISNEEAIIEIFTEGYGWQPITIRGAGAGSKVTARGVYSDILKIGREL